ncbi:MAG: nuclear transport factor 2 family protein [Caulobacterales bacterium]|nr:nuclear transport factor 2 family protein [Caulobacterales bacterium]
MSKDSIEDRLAIRERIEAYSDAVFRRDATDWIANWSDEAVWRLPGLEVSGKPQILAAWTQAMDGFDLAGFFATPGMIEVDGATARARVYTQEVLVGRDGKVLRIVGVYDDRLDKTGGAWLFTERSYTVLHAQ